MEIKLDGRVAVITGGSKGLGLAMAQRFAASGADVAILARGQEGLDAALPEIVAVAKGRVMAVACDVSKAADIQRAYDAVMGRMGKIDIVVNNAGQSRTGAFESVTDEVWQEDLDLKLFAAIRLTRLAWAQMRERKWGRVINVLNIGAKTPRAGSAPTTISRAAGMALTKVLAGEGAPDNVLVNAMLVGVIVSDQIKRRHAARGGNVTLEEQIAEAGKPVPMGRMGTAEEFANLACFLASDQGGYITGTAINVDGGMSPVV
jgi:NAD(P)-dependent dehydrogenase (short-subunit alcohol dehydrogenase family)